jgi:hypothetical protein
VRAREKPCAVPKFVASAAFLKGSTQNRTHSGHVVDSPDRDPARSVLSGFRAGLSAGRGLGEGRLRRRGG